MSVTENSYPRETDELVYARVTFAGAAPDGFDVELAAAADTARPSAWVTPVAVTGGLYGLRISGYAPGYYRLFARAVGADESPVLDCGEFRVT